MTEKDITLYSFILVGITVAGYVFWKRMKSALPRKWHRELVLKFRESYVKNGQFIMSDYVIENNTITYTRKYDNPVGLIKCYKLNKKDLNLLLEIMYKYRFSKIKMQKFGYVVYNGDSYSLVLMRKGHYLLNISNSAYEGLSPTDQNRFDTLVLAIRSLTEK